MGWCFSLAFLVCYFIHGEQVLLITSGLFAIAGSIGAIATKLDKK